MKLQRSKVALAAPALPRAALAAVRVAPAAARTAVAASMALALAPSVANADEPASAAQTATVVEDTLIVDAIVDPSLVIAASPGLGASLRFGKRDQRFMVGLTFQSGRLPSFSRSTFFDASVDTDDLEVDWTYAVGLDAQFYLWRFEPGRVIGGGGLFARGSLGYEAWTVRHDGQQVDIVNNYLTGALGVQWFPSAAIPAFVEAQVSFIGLFGQEDDYALGDETVELNSFAISPAVTLGYRFE